MDTNSNSLSSALLQSMDSFAKKVSQTSNGTLTIEAEVVEVVDEGAGIYKVQYLDNIFEATGANVEIPYEIGDMVYVIIPNGDFDKNKIILSYVTSKEAKYTSTDEELSYVPVGENLFALVAGIELCTYRPMREMVTADTTGFIQLFTAALRDSRTFNLTCRIKTNIDKERRIKGNYGIELTIPVIQEGQSKEYKVVLDINNLNGDPYDFSEYSLQNLYFTLPADMEYDTTKSPTISSFVQDFIGEYNKTALNDIWIKDIKLIPIMVIKNQSMSGYYLTLTVSEGSSFLPSRYMLKKIITPTPYLNGKITKIENFDCYWFRENCLVDVEHDKFNRLGGVGWEILNEKTNVVINEDGSESYQYITNKYEQEVLQNEIHFATKYKCVLVRNDKTVSQTITIRNLSNLVDLQLISTTGSDTYVEGVGKVRLIIRYYEAGITDLNIPTANINYAWQRYDKLGHYLDNDFYTIERINEKKIINGKSYYETEISYDILDIDSLNTISCTVYSEVNNGTDILRSIVGTSTITISTIPQMQAYTIRVENGDKLYKYDINGDSPKVADYDGPLSSIIKGIPPLSITLFKPNGSEFTIDEYAATRLEWLIPIKSMITISSGYKKDTTSNKGYYTIKGSYNDYKDFVYDIANVYNKRKSDNTIIVRAYLKDNKAETAINIRFIKDGESGTNGSKYSAIVTYGGLGYGELAPNGTVNKLQLIYAADKTKWYYYNPAEGIIRKLEPGQQIATLKVDTYSDGEKITTPEVVWNVFDIDNVYDRIVCPFTIDTNGNISLKSDGTIYWSDLNVNYCGTIQAQVRAKKINAGNMDESMTGSEEYVYAYYPVEITRVISYDYLNSFVPTLSGGFSQVEYASDGTNPQYDSSENFEVVNSSAEQIKELYNYVWSGSSNLSINSDEQEKSCKVIPTTKYDNGAAKNYVRVGMVKTPDAESKVVTIKEDLTEILNNRRNELIYYSQLNSDLDILNFLWYNEYVEKLNKASKVFKTKAELKNIGEELLKDINNLISLMENYKTISGVNAVLTEALSRRVIWSSFLSLIAQLGINVQAVNIIQNGYNPNKFYLTEINTQLDDSAILITINDSIKNYNNKIRTIYSNYFNQLDNKFINLQNYIIEVVNGVNLYINNSKWETLTGTINGINLEAYRFKPLYENLKIYANLFINEENYNYEKIVNNILKPIKNSTNPLKAINYNEKIIELSNEVFELERKLNDYSNLVLSSAVTNIIHIKPIIMIYNRYEMSNINGWDGNKVKVSDGYIIAPQVGAGKKENGLFTGMVMGVKQTEVKSSLNQRIGMFGFDRGIQSLFLNAEDGSAIFGKSGNGQIIIDPKAEIGMLYSSNYWKDYNTKDGKPINYNNSNKNGQGMLINLSEPEIRWGNGNFYVTSNGDLHAGGNDEGDVGGWYIGSSTLKSNNYKKNRQGILLDAGNDKIVLGSSQGRIYSGSHSELTSTSEGFCLNHEGLSIGSKVYIDKNGTLRLGSGAVGNIGKHWTIDVAANDPDNNSYIKYGEKGKSNSVYIGTDGIYLGNKFSVTSQGILTAKEGTFEGTLEAKDGHIGGWKILKDKLVNESNSNIYFSASYGINYNNVFKVDSNGNLTAYNANINGKIYATEGSFNGSIYAGNGTIGGWTINSSSIYKGKMTISSSSGINFNDKFKVDSSGKLEAIEANISGKLIAGENSEISGWTVKSNGLIASNGGLTIYTKDDKESATGAGGMEALDKNGERVWYIWSNGQAHFGTVNITGDLYLSDSAKATIKGIASGSSGTIAASSVYGELTNATISGSKVSGAVSTASHAYTATSATSANSASTASDATGLHASSYNVYINNQTIYQWIKDTFKL